MLEKQHGSMNTRVYLTNPEKNKIFETSIGFSICSFNVSFNIVCVCVSFNTDGNEMKTFVFSYFCFQVSMAFLLNKLIMS